MKIKILKKEQIVDLLENPVPEDKELFEISFRNNEVSSIIKRELKKEYKAFRNYASYIGLVPSDKKALYPVSFYPTDMFRFEKAVPFLENFKTMDGSPLFTLHNLIFEEKDHGKLIAGKRKELGMKQADLAKVANMSVLNISHIEQGLSFNAPTVKKLCDILKIKFIFPDDLKLFERKR